MVIKCFQLHRVNSRIGSLLNMFLLIQLLILFWIIVQFTFFDITEFYPPNIITISNYFVACTIILPVLIGVVINSKLQSILFELELWCNNTFLNNEKINAELNFYKSKGPQNGLKIIFIILSPATLILLFVQIIAALLFSS